MGRGRKIARASAKQLAEVTVDLQTLCEKLMKIGDTANAEILGDMLDEYISSAALAEEDEDAA